MVINPLTAPHTGIQAVSLRSNDRRSNVSSPGYWSVDSTWFRARVSKPYNDTNRFKYNLFNSGNKHTHFSKDKPREYSYHKDFGGNRDSDGKSSYYYRPGSPHPHGYSNNDNRNRRDRHPDGYYFDNRNAAKRMHGMLVPVRTLNNMATSESSNAQEVSVMTLLFGIAMIIQFLDMSQKMVHFVQYFSLLLTKIVILLAQLPIVMILLL